MLPMPEPLEARAAGLAKNDHVGAVLLGGLDDPLGDAALDHSDLDRNAVALGHDLRDAEALDRRVVALPRVVCRDLLRVLELLHPVVNEDHLHARPERLGQRDCVLRCEDGRFGAVSCQQNTIEVETYVVDLAHLHLLGGALDADLH